MNYLLYQRTLGGEIRLSGRGLHSGKEANLTIEPGLPNSGICFIRVDQGYEIKATLENVADSKYATTLGINGISICTVEHLLAALYGLGIDNARIELDSSEVPIMDGSASPFVQRIKEVGYRTQEVPRRYLKLKEPVELKEGDKEGILIPSEVFKISYTINFDHPLLGWQSFETILSEESFESEICKARTFGFLREVPHMRKNGLALGGSLENAVVIGDSHIINGDGLRFKDECVRHKILDAIGDISLIGMPLLAHLILKNGGHSFHLKLIKKAFSETKKWKWTLTPSISSTPNFYSSTFTP